ncbi:MAG: alpha/beta hydrolase [Gemmataceae bacterium]
MRLSVGAVDLHGVVGPANGPPLLLLHGVLRSWRDFAAVLPALLPRWQVHAVDHRGHGQSDRCPGRYFVADYAADVISLVRDHLPPGVVIFGHSLGALTAVAAAAACPERVRAVVLEDPPSAAFLADVPASLWHPVWTGMRPLAASRAPVGEIARRLAEVRQPLPDGRTVRLGELRDAAALRFSAACLRDLDPDTFAPLLANRWLDGFDLAATCPGVRCPALLLRGEPALGGMLARADADAVVAHMADGAVVDVPGVGHLIHATATETTVRLVLAFLESLRGRADEDGDGDDGHP